MLPIWSLNSFIQYTLTALCLIISVFSGWTCSLVRNGAKQIINFLSCEILIWQIIIFPNPSPICSELPCDLRTVEALKHLNNRFTRIVQLKTQNNPPEEYKEAKFGLNVVQQDKGSNSHNWIGLHNLAYVQYMSSSHYFDRIWLITIGLKCTNYWNDRFRHFRSEETQKAKTDNF